ncbi:MAG: hypothetical protein Kow00129_07640 [Thermoleophilia bacterium]
MFGSVTKMRTATVVSALSVGLLVLAGCGEEQAGEVTTTLAQAEEGSGTGLDGNSEPGEVEPVAWGAGETVQEVEAVFREVAQEYPLATLYTPGELPEGTVMAEGWWPVTSSEEPPAPGEWKTNPRVVQGNGQPEVRLVLKTPDAWIELLQGVQGDLGNLPGEETMEVAGVEASVHAMLGGVVVQWSDGPHWYAVYARGLAAEDVKRLAQGMRPLR